MSPKIKLLAACVILSALIGSVVSRGGALPGAKVEERSAPGEPKAQADEVSLSRQSLERYGVKVEAAREWSLTPTLIAPGRIAFNSERMSHVGSPISGRVAEIDARLGDSVAKGATLAVVDSPELGEALGDYLQKRSALGVATGAAELAKSSYERAKKLFDESRGISLTELQKREGEFKAAQGGKQAAESVFVAATNRLRLFGWDAAQIAALEKTGRASTRYSLVAPIAGQVIERDLTLGELVRPEKQALFTVADLSTVWVLADIPEARLRGVGVGAAARVEVASDAPPIIGAVSYVSPQTDPMTRSGQVRIEVENTDGALKPGMFVRVHIAATNPGENHEPVLAVPEVAVQTIDGKPSLFVPVEGKEGSFVSRAVSVGPAVDGKVPILSGLKPGEPVVVAGSFIFKAELGKSAIDE